MKLDQSIRRMTPEEKQAKRDWGTGACQVRQCTARASYLLMQMNDGNQAEWGNINFALWKIMSPSVDLGQAPPGTEGAQYWYDLARTTNLSNIDFSNVRILTPTDAHSQVGDQEFLFLTPEPGTLALIGSGILGLYTQRRRFV